jgi:hypothetical protein
MGLRHAVHHPQLVIFVRPPTRLRLSLSGYTHFGEECSSVTTMASHSKASRATVLLDSTPCARFHQYFIERGVLDTQTILSHWLGETLS